MARSHAILIFFVFLQSLRAAASCFNVLLKNVKCRFEPASNRLFLTSDDEFLFVSLLFLTYFRATYSTIWRGAVCLQYRQTEQYVATGRRPAAAAASCDRRPERCNRSRPQRRQRTTGCRRPGSLLHCTTYRVDIGRCVEYQFARHATAAIHFGLDLSYAH